MKKTECETAVRHLASKWANMQKQPEGWHPAFEDFVHWLNENGYGHYLNFPSVVPAREVAEQWFDQELKQAWRN